MKRKLSFLLLIIIPFGNTLHAQQIKRCATTEYMQKQMAENPSLAQQMAAQEDAMQKYIAGGSTKLSNVNAAAVLTIPVVVHVVYKNATENISTAQIQSQIAVLNKDYRKLNSDAVNVPAVWQSIAADCQIEFCLAQRDPQGNATNGITRTPTTVTSFNTNDDVKYTSKGGQDIWNCNMYLNIWVCNLGNVAGYTHPMGNVAAVDGVVINYTCFGTTGTVAAPLDKGRTATHEIGHWFDLRHTWGDDGGSCTGTDYVTDTPNEADYSLGCPSFPKTDACSPSSPGVMFMNYMNYTDDVCMCMFTAGQLSRINLRLNQFGSGLQTSQGCLPLSVAEQKTLIKDIQLYPNPTAGKLLLNLSLYQSSDINITVYNIVGERITVIKEVASTGGDYTLDLTSQPGGIYFAEIKTGKESVVKKISIVK